MTFALRDVQEADLESVLELNESEVPRVGKVDLERMAWFAEHATYFRIATLADELAGFLVGFRPGTAYDSLNYLWFCDRYEDFAYVDRVAVAAIARRRGLASLLYEDFARAVPESVEFMTCEVNIRPSNESSMRFHERLGFQQVGAQTLDDGDKEVAMLAMRIRQ